MKKIICINCGSNEIDFKEKYYQCKHCHTKYRLPKEMQKEVSQTEKQTSKKSTNKASLISFFIITAILLLLYYGWTQYQANMIEKRTDIKTLSHDKIIKIDNSNAKINTQSIVINNYNVAENKVANKKEMKFWNLLFQREKLLHISSLITTEFNTYLLAGRSDYYNGVYLGELDKNGQEIWSRSFPIGDKISAIPIKDGYVVSYYITYDNPRTIILNSNKEVTHKLAIEFDAMVATEDGFVGVSQNELKSIGREGKTLWSTNLNREIIKRHNNQLVQLTDKSFIVVGVDKQNKLWINKYSPSGKLLWQHEASVYHYYLRKVIATSDGGFLLLAGNHIRISKYDQEGKQEWKNHANIDDTYLLSLNLIENSKGYIVTGRKKGKPLMVQFDFDGTKIWEKNIESQGQVGSIVKAFDGGYLVGINVNGKEPWLCKMDEKGNIKSDLNSSNYQAFSNTKMATLKNSTIKDVFVTNLTKIIGNSHHIQLSKNEKYLYASAVGGIHILDISNKRDPQTLSHFSKSKTAYIRHRGGSVSPVNRSIKDMKGEYKENYILNLKVSKDNRRIFALDGYHGFYILDIKNKKRPKLLLSLKDIYSHSMALSKDEKSIFIPIFSKDKFEVAKLNIATGNLKRSTIEQLDLTKDKPFVFGNQNQKRSNIVLISKDKILLGYSNKLFVYNLKKRKVVKKIKFSRGVKSIKISDNKKMAYVASQDEVYLINLENFTIEDIIYTGATALAYPSKDEKKLYISTNKGIKQLDISDRDNPKLEKIYKMYANDFILSQNENRLYIAGNSIGIFDFFNNDNNSKIVKTKPIPKKITKKETKQSQRVVGHRVNGKYTINHVKKALMYLRDADINIWLTRVYEQKDLNHAVTLNIKKSTKPVILLLESHREVTWVIKNPYKTKIEAIIIHSKKGLAKVEGEVEEQRIFPVHGVLAYGDDVDDEHECFCQKGRFVCSGSGLRWSKIAQHVVWYKKITGLSGAYHPKSLYVPEKFLNDNEYAQIKKQIRSDEKIRQACIQEKVKLLKINE